MNTEKIEIISYIEKLLDKNIHEDIIEQVIIDYLKEHPEDIDKRIQFANAW